MDNQRQEKEKKAMRSKSTIRREKQRAGKLLRRRSLRSVGTFMSRLLRTLGSLAHLGDADDAEDDDGGFRDSAPSTLGANSANPRGEGGRQVRRDEEKEDEKEEEAAAAAAAPHGSVKERLSWCYGDKTPGVLGLKNHGNTCFMNAVVQCLSNTDLLAEYLGLERYKSDLLSRSRLNGLLRSDEATLDGEVTQQLATLVRALWTLDYTPQLSVDFKSVVAKYGSQFRGNSQHDALEFLLWLLDRMHEDVSSSPNSHNSKTKASGKLTCRNLDSPVALSKRPFYKHHQCVSRPHCAGQGSSDCTRGWNRRETSGTLRAFKVERGNGLIGFSSVFCLNAPVVRACTTPMSKTGLSAPQRAVSLDVKRGASRERSLVF